MIETSFLFVKLGEEVVC